MRFAIRSNGFDSDQHPIRNYLIRNGGRTSIRASGFPSWPSHLKGELTLATAKINSTGDSDNNFTSFLANNSDYKPVTRMEIEDHVSGGVADYYQTNNWGSVSAETKEGLNAINLSSTDNITIAGDSDVLGTHYTMYFLWYPRVSNSGWRTFYRGSNHHQPIIQDGGLSLGAYIGGFKDTGYDIELNKWQTLIVTGDNNNNLSKYYVDGNFVGSHTGTKTGTTWEQLGYSGQAPGWFREAGILSTLLDSDGAVELHEQLEKIKNGTEGGTRTIDTRVYNPDSETMLNDSDFNFSITYYPQLTNNNNSISFRDSITNRVRIVAGGSVRDQYTPEGRQSLISYNNLVPYDADAVKNEDSFTRDITVRRQVPTNVSGGGGGGGGGGDSSPGQIWY